MNIIHKDPVYIGIDTGVNTGVAVWSKGRKCFLKLEKMSIHRAFNVVLDYYLNERFNLIRVRIEDARKRSVAKGNPDYYKKLQGAGSVKRDAKAWEDFCTDYAIPFEMVAPQSNTTKVTTESFRQMTGLYVECHHTKDAAMLVMNY